jgi:glycosyltransferase involved in cell wall biosynthesis
MAGVPVVVNTLHGFYFHDRMHPTMRRFYITMEKIATRCSDVILSQNSEDIQTAIREGICPADKIRFLGNGIDTRRFDSARFTSGLRVAKRRELGLPEGAPVVGFVGRLVREKGVLELFEAARIMREWMPNAQFLFVGPIDTEKLDAITPEAARQFGIDANCHFVGLRQDMPELYAVMDVFVLPSHREGFPRSPMEASAMGVPCVVTDIRGCREAVEHNVNGLLVPLRDIPSLAKAIYDLLTNEGKASSMRAAGRAMALERFDEQLVFGRVKAEYIQLLKAKGLAGP